MIIKFFLLIIIFVTGLAKADPVIYGLKGLNNAFDTVAFYEYAKIKKAKPFIIEQNKIEYINQILDKTQPNEYILYGFSFGASTVSKIVKDRFIKNKSLPIEIITIGAYHTTDVDFTKYNVQFVNFFDLSGQKNKSPGYHLPNVPHMRMQQVVNNILLGKP